MRYVRYCGVALLLAVVLFAAPIWPKTVVRYSHSGHTLETIRLHSHRMTFRVPFPSSDYGWIESMPTDMYLSH
jgi:hypothetical protein